MSDTEQFETCIACQQPLLVDYIEASIGIDTALLYCATISCSRYLLYYTRKNNRPQPAPKQIASSHEH